MKKTKLISFLMVVCMLSVMVMASCESGMGIADLQNRKPVTLVVYYQVNDSTTPEALALVETAINEITQLKLTTKIKLVGLKPSEYEAGIDSLFEAYDVEQEKLAEIAASIKESEKESKEQAKRDKAAGITAAATRRPTDPPETTLFDYYNEGGRIKWDEPKKDQIDIFLITSSEMFEKLAREERLQGLDDELSTKAKVLKEFIHQSIMLAGKFGDKTLAIPTNKAIGKATYIAVNKRLAEKYELDLEKVKEYQHLTEYLELVKENEPDIAMLEGPFELIKNYESVFPDMPDFAVASAAGKTLVYTPEQEPTEAPTRGPTEPPEPETDENGDPIPTEAQEEETTEEETTIPGTTAKPKPIPAQMVLEPDKINISNMYTAAAYATLAALNQEYREKGLFETSPVPDGKERAAFIFTGTLEEKYALEATDEYEYEYIMYMNPRAEKHDLQTGMYGVSISSPNVMRAMEIITLLNTNKQFKNLLQFGILGTHYIYNDNGEIEIISNEYSVDLNHTGNQFIRDLMVGENPNKWSIAMEQNLLITNSVFLNFYLDKSKLTPASLEAVPAINSFSQEVKQALLTGNIPSEYESIDMYLSDYVGPKFTDMGTAELITEIKAQTNPE